MSANIFTIDSIEGNSFLGGPVFSHRGKTFNTMFKALSTRKQTIGEKVNDDEEEEQLVDPRNQQFKIDSEETKLPDIKSQPQKSISINTALSPFGSPKNKNFGKRNSV